VELVEEALARPDELNCYLHLDAEGALAAARAADRHAPLGGIPLCVKDIVDVAGMPTTAGAAGWTRHPADDAPAVARLRAAGAVIVGKGHTNEFAYGIDGRNPHWGDCRNPHDAERLTGGSSSGPAAATAAGLALGGLGTDTSGSLRVPASLCGVVGLRPSRGLVPRAGIVPLAWSYDVAGPLARTAADAALLLDALAGAPLESNLPARGRAAVGRPLAGVGIGVLEELVEGRCEPYVVAGFAAALDRLRELGAHTRPLRLEYLGHGPPAHYTIQMSEAAAVHAPWFADQAPRYAPSVRLRLEGGWLLPAHAYLVARRAHKLIAAEARAAMDREGLHALAAPATPLVAPRRDAETVALAGGSVPVREALLSATVPLTQLDGPVLCFPIGDREGLPFGMQLAGRHGDDALLLAAGGAFAAVAE
jgi:aspartyl-tRNA(Asn)/glutamyl-tRNA(Gln) amidotransferase subunit A